MGPLDDVRPEALQSGAASDVDQLVVIHWRIISRNRPARTVESPDDEQKEVRVGPTIDPGRGAGFGGGADWLYEPVGRRIGCPCTRGVPSGTAARLLSL
jgi:hypothetical protein